MKFLHKGTIPWLVVSVILVVVLSGLLYRAWGVKKTFNAEQQETQGHKVVMAMATEAIVSKAYVAAAPKAEQASEVVPEAPQEVGLHDAHGEIGKETAAHAPVPEKTVMGALEINKTGRPKIVIIIGGLGLSVSSTERALQLPESISFGFSPYAPEAQKWADMAAASKHDLLLNLPLEPLTYPVDDPGPMALLTGLSDGDNIKRLDGVLGKLTGYVGVYSTPDDGFSIYVKKIRPVLDSIKGRNLLFIYGGSNAGTILQQLATANALPVLLKDVQLDAELSAVSVEGKLAELERLAKQHGYAIGMGNPYPLTVKTVQTWLETVKSRGFDVVPISALVVNFKK